MKTPAAVLLWALADCSGAASNSSSLTIDRDFIPDSTAHLWVGLDAACAVAGSASGSERELTHRLERVTGREFDANTDIALVDSCTVPGRPGAIQHDSTVTLARLSETNQAALTRARSFLKRGGDEALMQVVADVDERARLRPAPSTSDAPSR